MVANAAGHTIRIADCATGTAIWPIDVAALFAEKYPDIKVKLYGTDISAEQFPADEKVPSNVELKVRNSLKSFSEKHHEKYDMIHVRAVALALGDGEWQGVVENLQKCLSKSLF